MTQKIKRKPSLDESLVNSYLPNSVVGELGIGSVRGTDSGDLLGCSFGAPFVLQKTNKTEGSFRALILIDYTCELLKEQDLERGLITGIN